MDWTPTLSTACPLPGTFFRNCGRRLFSPATSCKRFISHTRSLFPISHFILTPFLRSLSFTCQIRVSFPRFLFSGLQTLLSLPCGELLRSLFLSFLHSLLQIQFSLQPFRPPSTVIEIFSFLRGFFLHLFLLPLLYYSTSVLRSLAEVFPISCFALVIVNTLNASCSRVVVLLSPPPPRTSV